MKIYYASTRYSARKHSLKRRGDNVRLNLSAKILNNKSVLLWNLLPGQFSYLQ